MGIREKATLIKCEDCGDTENIYHVPCPYDYDVNNIIRYVYVCEECYEERKDDI